MVETIIQRVAPAKGDSVARCGIALDGSRLPKLCIVVEIVLQPPHVLLLPGITGEDRCFLDTIALDLSEYVTETISYPGISAASDVLMSIPVAARRASSQVAHHADGRRVVLIGYSYGGNLAFELAHILIARSFEVDLLILIDPALPNTAFSVAQDTTAEVAACRESDRPATAYALRPVRLLLWLVARLMPARTRKKLVRRVLYELRIFARRSWKPVPIRAKTLHIVSGQLAPVVTEGWTLLCPRIRQIFVPGSHIGILRPPARSHVAEAILAAMPPINGPTAAVADQDVVLDMSGRIAAACWPDSSPFSSNPARPVR